LASSRAANAHLVTSGLLEARRIWAIFWTHQLFSSTSSFISITWSPYLFYPVPVSATLASFSCLFSGIFRCFSAGSCSLALSKGWSDHFRGFSQELFLYLPTPFLVCGPLGHPFHSLQGDSEVFKTFYHLKLGHPYLNDESLL
jgi:hypothetical protein